MSSIMSQQLYGMSASANVISGLASGLDTESMIQSMLAGTKNRINREYQSKQSLIYKQEAFRDVSRKLLDFQEKYFSYVGSSDKNIISPSFFESNTFNSSNSSVNVTGDASNIKNFTINSISSVASSASFNSTKTVTDATITSGVIPTKTSTLAGDSLTINYKGEDYTITLSEDFGNGTVDVTAQNVADEIGSQISQITGLENLSVTTTNGGNRISVTASDDALTITGASSEVLSSLNMTVGSEPISSANITAANLTTDATSVLSDESNYISLSLNGISKQINMSATNSTVADTVADMQSQIDTSFGAGRITVSYDDVANTISFETNSATDTVAVSDISTELGGFLGIDVGMSTKLSTSKSIADAGITGLVAQDTYEISINDVNISITSDMSVKQIADEISRSSAGVKAVYSDTTNSFTVTSTETGSHSRVDIQDVSGNLAESLFGVAGVDYTIKDGTDTVMNYTLNGATQDIVRSTEDFVLDGMNIDLNKGSVTTEPVEFNVIENTDKVVEKMEEFIKDYNEIIDTLGSKLRERPEMAYKPLTPDQRESMEKDDIELWEAAAKKGSLFGEKLIRNVYTNLRTAVTGVTDTSSLTAYDVGISTIPLDTSGKLRFDSDKFRQMLTEKPEEVKALFTGNAAEGETSGISQQLVNVIRDNVGSYGTRGYLIEEAGLAEGNRVDKNSLSRQIDLYDKKMDRLRDHMAKEEQRYVDQFVNLERVLSQLNAQSSVFYEQME